MHKITEKLIEDAVNGLLGEESQSSIIDDLLLEIILGKPFVSDNDISELFLQYQ